jgi:hypothetical protein
VDVTVPAALSTITVYPPVAYLLPCGTATLEVTGHYDDGVARDLSSQPGLSMMFATGNAAQSGASGIVVNAVLDDSVTVTYDGVDSAPIPIRALVPDDLGSCVVDTTSTTTTLPSTTSTTTTAPSTTTTQDAATTTTTTMPEASTTTSTTTTPASSTTTSTLAPGCQSDAECDDGDACTVDACAPGGCEHVAATGLEGAECLLSAALSEPLCPAGTIGPRGRHPGRRQDRGGGARRERAQHRGSAPARRFLNRTLPVTRDDAWLRAVSPVAAGPSPVERDAPPGAGR